MVAVVCLVVGLLLMLLGNQRSRTRARQQRRESLESLPAPREDGQDLPRAAIVVNPTKFDDVAQVRARVAGVCADARWGEPIWLETTKDDPGTGQAREAVERGASLVCALGGDGTVRAVAAGLLDGDVPMGLLPGGTGNLLARNLDLPVDDLGRALQVALTGKDLAIDVGAIRVRPDATQDQESDYFFLVMAGMGFDASVMADAPERLKAQFGWPAYVVAGVKHLNGKRFAVDAKIDDHPPFRRRVRTVVVGNVGRLQGGVELLPDAQVADGELDVVMLSPKGLVGWASVGASILTRNRRGHSRIEHHRCRAMHLTLAQTQEVQLDGDPIGPAHALDFHVKPGALTVRVG